MGGYYNLDDSIRRCDVGTILERAGRISNEKHARAVVELVRSLPECVSVANVRADIREHRKGVIADKLSLALVNRSPEAAALVKEYQALVEGADFSKGDRDAELIDLCGPQKNGSDTGDSAQLIELIPQSLNGLVDGGAKRGHQILIFGRPESGKTLVAINLVCGFLHQKLDVLYVANEEPASDILLRMRQRLLKQPKQYIRANEAEVIERLQSAPLGKLRIADLSPGTFSEIQSLLDKQRYDVVVLDQLRNIRVEGGTRVEELENAATSARNLAKRAGVLVVSITQAGDSASGKPVLELNDVDGSKTGIPAQCDLMLGVGTTKASWEAGVITLATPKNKLSGIHGHVQVTVNKQTGALK